MRHLLTSLAQRALLQPEVRDSPERKRSRRAVATAGRTVWPGLILTAHQHGTGNTYVNTTHRHRNSREQINTSFICNIATREEGEEPRVRFYQIRSNPCCQWDFFFHPGFQLARQKSDVHKTAHLGKLNYWIPVWNYTGVQLPAKTDALFKKIKA